MLLPLFEWVLPDADPETFEVIHAAVRKLAHVVEYAILALLSFRALSTPDTPPGRAFALAFGLCVVLASTDEAHQAFVASRTGALSDVLLDSFGAGLGLAALALWRFSLGRRLPT